MRIAVFSPYGNFPGADQTSSNFIFLLASYLLHRKSEVLAIKCDGCLDRCSLDLVAVGSAKRPCLACMNSQKNLISWADLTEQSLSAFLLADDLKKINQNFSNAEFLSTNLPSGGVELLSDYCTKYAADNVQVAKLQKSALSLSFAAKKLLIELKPKLLLTHSSNDLLTGILSRAFAEQGVTVACYHSSSTEDELLLSTNKNTETLKFGFYSSNIQHFRSDPSTWDEQLREAIIQNVSFLGLQSNQLSFHI